MEFIHHSVPDLSACLHSIQSTVRPLDDAGKQKWVPVREASELGIQGVDATLLHGPNGVELSPPMQQALELWVRHMLKAMEKRGKKHALLVAPRLWGGWLQEYLAGLGLDLIDPVAEEPLIEQEVDPEMRSLLARRWGRRDASPAVILLDPTLVPTWLRGEPMDGTSRAELIATRKYSVAISKYKDAVLFGDAPIVDKPNGKRGLSVPPLAEQMYKKICQLKGFDSIRLVSFRDNRLPSSFLTDPLWDNKGWLGALDIGLWGDSCPVNSSQINWPGNRVVQTELYMARLDDKADVVHINYAHPANQALLGRVAEEIRQAVQRLPNSDTPIIVFMPPLMLPVTASLPDDAHIQLITSRIDQPRFSHPDPEVQATTYARQVALAGLFQRPDSSGGARIIIVDSTIPDPDIATALSSLGFGSLSDIEGAICVNIHSQEREDPDIVASMGDNIRHILFEASRQRLILENKNNKTLPPTVQFEIYLAYTKAVKEFSRKAVWRDKI